MLSIDIITQEALSLPNNLKVELVEKLLASIEIESDENSLTKWLNVAKKRRNQIINKLM